MGLALVAAGFLISSCGSSSTPQSTGSTTRVTPPSVGSSIRMRTSGTAIVVTVRRVTFPLRGSGILLGPGDRGAGVDVSVRNVGHGVYDSSSESDVGLRTSSGDLAEPSFAAQGQCATSEIDFLKLVQPGESRSG